MASRCASSAWNERLTFVAAAPTETRDKVEGRAGIASLTGKSKLLDVAQRVDAFAVEPAAGKKTTVEQGGPKRAYRGDSAGDGHLVVLGATFVYRNVVA